MNAPNSMIRRIALPALAFAAVLASPARADSRLWSLCTPGGLRSCHAVNIATTPVMVGVTRVGTAIQVSVTNLQGSGVLGSSNQVSGLYQLVFTRPVTTAGPGNVRFPVAAMTGAGASGSAPWLAVATNAVTTSGTFAWLELRGSVGGTRLIGGCTAGATLVGSITAQTCGTTASAIFTFTISAHIDAGQLNNLFALAYGASGSNSCYTAPDAVPFAGQQCDMLFDPLAPVPTVPEPATIALLATGLAGVGLKRLRRRR